MRSEIDVKEFSAIVREFASYKSVIQGCSQKTVEEYLLDLRTFFRYLLADGDESILNDPEAFASLPIHTVDLDELRAVTTDQIYAFLLYTDIDRGNKTSAKARKLSAIKGLYKFLINKITPRPILIPQKRKKPFRNFSRWRNLLPCSAPSRAIPNPRLARGTTPS